MPRQKRFNQRQKKFCRTLSSAMRPPGSTPHSSVVEAQAEAPVERHISVETATYKRFSISACCPSTGEPSGESSASQDNAASDKPSPLGRLEGYHLVNCEWLSQGVSEIGLCSACKAPVTLMEDMITRRGLVSMLKISCTNTACKKRLFYLSFIHLMQGV